MSTLWDYADTLPSPPASVAFHGETYDAPMDHGRLRGQLLRVFARLSDGSWHTLRDLAASAGGSEASVSARLRDLRKPQYGKREVHRRRISGGLYEYRISGP